jgi:uncharacterized protein YndB with AHSA1/START domain
MMAALAEMERDLIRERTLDGLHVAEARAGAAAACLPLTTMCWPWRPAVPRRAGHRHRRPPEDRPVHAASGAAAPTLARHDGPGGGRAWADWAGSTRRPATGREVICPQRGYPGRMAVLNVLVDCGPPRVWEVLSDGWAYADWVVGTRHIRHVDDRWPEPGAQIHYTVGVGRWTIEDVTTVRLVEPGHRLELEAYAGRVGSARISIALLQWGEDRTLVILDEHPLSGPGARWHSVLVDALLRIRNRRMVRSLARVVREHRQS